MKATFMTNYRNDARQAVEKAKNELASGDDDRVKYAALELRLALESLAYDKMQTYKDEIPPELYETWQPRKVLSYLAEIDPHAQMEMSISAGIEDAHGQPPPEMKHIGVEKPLTVKNLKDHYDAIGNKLHSPTLKQLREGNISGPASLRERCENVVTILDRVLSSIVYNVNLGVFSSMECQRCNATIRRRMSPESDEPVIAKCYNCGADYTITDKDDGQVLWSANTREINCPANDCDEKIALWPDEIKPGFSWTCKGCDEKYAIGMTITKAGDSV